jgi:hypothetical protein
LIPLSAFDFGFGTGTDKARGNEVEGENGKDDMRRESVLRPGYIAAKSHHRE